MNKYERTIKFYIEDLKQLRRAGGTLEAIAAQFKISRTKKHKELDHALEASGSIFATFHKTVSLDVYRGAFDSNTASNDHRVHSFIRDKTQN
ncbi:hypothetical protein [Oenococcus kitaharae]|uniref:Uncharacterized protein n=1 Tax=Oenococcus kitaharae DSM 17330 TaxID=1045004 RepID=G9WII4_9LACO|nr:hypothetical protein [Oenococcus kitaharae]EHN58996.1 hypothetical protein OKIT_0891 [Oenococcus kitaharae DSM 17330]OEY81698.1 hypothetical protein NT96_07900 [Oenococcus kitaharae]OEY83929.1 hypothetical protein NT95_01960 [Oenococcus kitaharae]OEY85715.1 hypothetical protein NV75_04475 [Oenococcus kitaharae]